MAAAPIGRVDRRGSAVHHLRGAVRSCQQRLDRNRQWARRNTQGEYLLRRLLSYQRCGLAANVWNNGTYAYYRCKEMDALVMRGRAGTVPGTPGPTDRLDAVVWDDVRELLSEPTVL